MKLKILSFDCEVLPLKSKFPTADICPIVLISFTANYNIMNEKKKVIFVLNRNKSIAESVIVRNDVNNDVIVRFNDERRMIKGWEALVRDCDVLTGYNSSGFDIPYIVDRAKILGVGKIRIGNSDDGIWYKKHNSKGLSVYSIGGVKGRIIFDVLYLIRRADESNTIKKEFKFKSNKLEDTARIALGNEKKEFPIEQINEYWENGTNEEKFINYCSVDSELALEFVTKFRLLDKFLMLSRESGKVPQDVIDSQGFGALVESLLMRRFTKIGRVVPCRGQASGYSVDDSEEDELEGAFVKEPKLGITDNIASGDYTSLYPTTMIKNNICQTTVILDNSIPDNENMIIVKNDEDVVMGRFVKPSVYKGIIPTIQEELMTKRAASKAEIKKYQKGSIEYMMLDADQNGKKILLNTFYGFTGEQGNKVYCHSVAASVTGAGRRQIKYTIEMIERTIVSYNGKNYKLEVVAGDTDSCYVRVIPEIPEILNREIVVAVTSIRFAEINATLEKPMKLAFENYVKRMFVTAKKRYTMVTVDENGKESVVSKGIETQRKDWCDLASDALTIANDIILHEQDINIATKKIIDFARDEADRLRAGKIDNHKLILSKALSKSIAIQDYNAIHVKVARKMFERGKPSETGDRISYLILNNGGESIGDQAEEAEYVIAGKSKYKIDYDYYVNKQLFPPIERMLTAIGADKKLLYADKRQKTLMDLL